MNKDIIKNKIKNPTGLKTDQLFRFAYHGLANKELFKNAIALSKKLFILSLEQGDDYAYDKSLFYFESKKTNPKKYVLYLTFNQKAFCF